jgi:hypothetical protein
MHRHQRLTACFFSDRSFAQDLPDFFMSMAGAMGFMPN